MSALRSSIRSPLGGSHGRHRKPKTGRRAGAARLLRGGLLTSVAGTVAVTSAPPASAEGPTETTAELPTLPSLDLDAVVSDSAIRAAAATQDYVTDAVAREATEEAEQRAVEDARREAAERREREEARRAAAAEAEAAAEEERLASAESAPPAASGGSGGSVVSYILSQLGDAYGLGSVGPDAWDCSSLVQAAYASVGVSLPRTAAEQSVAGTQVSLDALQPGDILYWGGAGSAYHVAVYVGGGSFVGAQNSSTGVVERTLDWDPPTGAVRVM
ncbi:C40 family peptidase [Streptomyces sp. 4N509B]|uniref:C40 family peptidase n=1 Tax=Streptomyces sp. 4N509B TaxID=3457413 RepID=UPI003FCF5F6F